MSHDDKHGALPRPGEPTWYSPESLLTALDAHHRTFISGTGKDPENYSSMYSEAAGFIRHLLSARSSIEPLDADERTQLLEDLRDGISDDPTMAQCRTASEAMKVAAQIISSPSATGLKLDRDEVKCISDELHALASIAGPTRSGAAVPIALKLDTWLRNTSADGRKA